MKRLLPLVLGTSLIAFIAACSGDTPGRDAGFPDGGGLAPDLGFDDRGMPIRPDAGPDGGPGPNDSGTDGGPTVPDSGPVTMTCNNPEIAAPTSGTCNFLAGSGAATLIRGNLVAPEGYLENAHLLIGGDGVILCAACDCSSNAAFADAKRVECKDGVVSPGLINAHDHITYNVSAPAASRTERYEHRHDWRRGNNGHTEIPSPPNSLAAPTVRWSELRNVLAGGTAVNGSGTAPGLTRNLDRAADSDLSQPAVRYQTFPLDDSNGTTRTMGCMYGDDGDTPADLTDVDAYTPHVAEGINLEAFNEFACMSGIDPSGVQLITRKTAIIHGIGLHAQDYASMAQIGASLIWSPRSNIDLYGHTAQVTVAKRLGVRIALGTDWVATGSMNMARELRCADDYNRNFLGGYFSDRDLVDMATINGAEALASDDFIGSLRPGRQADIAIFDGSTNRGYRAVLDASPDEVVLVMRGGDVLYGDDALVASLLGGGDGCESLDVCTRAKSVCLQRDTGMDLAGLRAAIANNPYDLFFCGEPTGEPTCLPSRPNEFTGMSRMGDQDGDGMLDMNDNCPTVFNPPRPLDGTMQADEDGDTTGDACDVCPLNANTETCSAPDPNDRDGDGAPNATDNCPGDANMDQADQDSDMIGDVCDACPMVANPNGGACPATVYAVKQGMTTGAVSIQGVVVTAVAPLGYFVQAVPGTPAYDATLGADYSAVFVYTSAAGMKPALGDRVTVNNGTVALFFGQTQITGSTFTVEASGVMLPAPVAVQPAEVATGGARAAALEAVLVEVTGVVVDSITPAPGTSDTPPTNEFTVGGLRVNDLMYLLAPFPRVGQRIGFIRGVLRFANDNMKLEPRSAADVGAAAGLVGLEPATAFVRIGGAVQMTAILSRTATQATVVTLSSSRPSVSVPASVTVPMGTDRATFDATGVATSTAAVTITARLGGVSLTAALRPYDDAAPRRIVALELDATVLPLGGMTTGRLALDLPAPVGGAAVLLAVTPAGLGVVMPRTATIAAGALDTAFVLMADAVTTGPGSLTATLGTETASVGFAVSRSQTRAVSMPGDLIITEVLYNVTGSAELEREWFEVHNPTADTLTLTGLTVSDNTGPGITLTAAAGSIPPGGYRVFATTGAATNGGIANPVVYGTGEAFTNSGDAARLLVGNTVIDEVTWAAGWPGQPDGQAMCLRAPYGDNAVQASWGASVGTFGPNPDRGSPGVASDATNCP